MGKTQSNTLTNSEPANLKEGTWYTIRIIVSGNQYEWFTDNQSMWNFEGGFPKLTSGAVGLYTRNCEARFDDVTITGLQNLHYSATMMAVQNEEISDRNLCVNWN